MSPDRFREIQKALAFAQFLQEQPVFVDLFSRCGRGGIWSADDKALIESGRECFVTSHAGFTDAGYIGHAVSALRRFNDSSNSWSEIDGLSAIAHLERRERKIFYAITFAQRVQETAEYRQIFERAGISKAMTQDDKVLFETANQRFRTAYPDAGSDDLILLPAADPLLRRIAVGQHTSPTSDSAFAWLCEFETARERMESATVPLGTESQTIH